MEYTHVGCNERSNKERVRTHALEFLFEAGHVLTVGDAEVVVGVIGLVYAIRRSGGAQGQDGGGAVGALGVADFVDGDHIVFYLNMHVMDMNKRPALPFISVGRGES